MSPLWVGIDPGARSIGVVARTGTRLLDWAVLDLRDIDPQAIRITTTEFTVIRDRILAVAGDGPVRYAVEDTEPPTPYHRGKLRFTNPGPLLRTAELVGRILDALPDVVLVTPAGHGRRPLSTYPPELVGRVERAHALRTHGMGRPAPGNGRLRHARSAWDVAGAAPVSERIARAERAVRDRRSR